MGDFNIGVFRTSRNSVLPQDRADRKAMIYRRWRVIQEIPDETARAADGLEFVRSLTTDETYLLAEILEEKKHEREGRALIPVPAAPSPYPPEPEDELFFEDSCPCGEPLCFKAFPHEGQAAQDETIPGEEA